MLRPTRLPLLPLDLGPARGMEVSLVARQLRARTLLRELRRGSCSFAADAPCPRCLLGGLSPLIYCTLCDVVSRECLPRSAPVRDPFVFPELRIEKLGRIMEPALGWASPVAGLGVLARGQAVESVVAGTRLGRCPPACSRGAIDRGLLTALGRVMLALALCLGEIGRGLRTATALGVTGCFLRSARSPSPRAVTEVVASFF